MTKDRVAIKEIATTIIEGNSGIVEIAKYAGFKQHPPHHHVEG
jgi:hypothetical protein